MADESIAAPDPWGWVHVYETALELPGGCTVGDVGWVEENNMLYLCSPPWTMLAEEEQARPLYVGCEPGDRLELPDGEIAVCTDAGTWDMHTPSQGLSEGYGGLVIFALMVALGLGLITTWRSR